MGNLNVWQIVMEAWLQYVYWQYDCMCGANRVNIHHLVQVFQATPPLNQQAIHLLQLAIHQPPYLAVIHQHLEWIIHNHPALLLAIHLEQFLVQCLEDIQLQAILRLSLVDIHHLSSLDIPDHILRQAALTAIHQDHTCHVNISFNDRKVSAHHLPAQHSTAQGDLVLDIQQPMKQRDCHHDLVQRLPECHWLLYGTRTR